MKKFLYLIFLCILIIILWKSLYKNSFIFYEGENDKWYATLEHEKLRLSNEKTMYTLKIYYKKEIMEEDLNKTIEYSYRYFGNKGNGEHSQYRKDNNLLITHTGQMKTEGLEPKIIIIPLTIKWKGETDTIELIFKSEK